MARIYVLFLVVAAIVVFFFNIQDTGNLENAAARIREGSVHVGSNFSTNYLSGRFHEIHVFSLGVSCTTCHDKNSEQNDLFLLPRPEYAALGQGDRYTCLGCHKLGGIGTPWYTGYTSE